MPRRRSRLIRFLAHLGAFLLVGIIITIALAWICAQWDATRHDNGTRIQMDGGYINLEYFSGFGVERIDWFAVKSANSAESTWALEQPYPEWVPEWSTVRSLNVGAVVEAGMMQVNQRAYGWPTLAFRNLTRTGRPVDWRDRAADTTELAMPQATEFSIIWPSFALNTILFGGGPWLIFFAPFQLQRALRRTLHLCPHCAYPIGASDVCTECGKPVTGGGAPSA